MCTCLIGVCSGTTHCSNACWPIAMISVLSYLEALVDCPECVSSQQYPTRECITILCMSSKRIFPGNNELYTFIVCNFTIAA